MKTYAVTTYDKDSRSSTFVINAKNKNEAKEVVYQVTEGEIVKKWTTVLETDTKWMKKRTIEICPF